MGRLCTMNDALEAAARARLVDGGFAKLDDIVALAAAGVTVYAPPPTPRGSRDRCAPLPGDRPALAEWRRRMGTDAARSISKQRAAEPVDVQTSSRGLVRPLERGAKKAKTVLHRHATAHDMARPRSLKPASTST